MISYKIKAKRSTENLFFLMFLEGWGRSFKFNNVDFQGCKRIKWYLVELVGKLKYDCLFTSCICLQSFNLVALLLHNRRNFWYSIQNSVPSEQIGSDSIRFIPSPNLLVEKAPKDPKNNQRFEEYRKIR